MLLINAVLLALWPVLPLLIVCYVRQSLIARRLRPTFALRKSETDELDRAYRLFGRVCERIKKISQHAEPTTGFRRFLGALSPVAAAANVDEMDDLHAHAQHLQATIRRLTRLPLQRLGHWIKVRSSRFACGVAVAAHVAALALFAPFHVFEKSAWAQQFITGANGGAWYPFDEQIFQANAVATGCACIAASLFYFGRRAALHRAYSFEFCFFGQLAKNGPVQEASDQREPEQAGDDLANGTDTSNVDEGSDWIEVLGVSTQATINEVKHAYKNLIKQNHPDRFQGMSPVLRTLAEAETKKINAAYRQALHCVDAN